MGIRIDAHAVDAEAFKRLIDRPLSHVFEAMVAGWARAAPCTLFNALDRDSGERVQVVPGGRVMRFRRNAESSIIPPDALAGIPFLQQSTRKYLSDPDGSCLSLEFLLRSLPYFDGCRYAQEVTSGFKGWWIGSALHGARDADVFAPDEFGELGRFLARIARGHDYGYPIEPWDRPPAPGDFPIIQDESDSRMAVFDAGECARFAELLDVLTARRPTFRPPPLLRDFEDPDWTDFVVEELRRFQSVPRLGLKNLRLVTFIG
jgi:hypothetical protein